jgi:hypothetical protein
MFIIMLINAPLFLEQIVGSPYANEMQFGKSNKLVLSAHEGYLVTDFDAYRLAGNVKRHADTMVRINKDEKKENLTKIGNIMVGGGHKMRELRSADCYTPNWPAIYVMISYFVNQVVAVKCFFVSRRLVETFTILASECLSDI